jgi:two-component system cell cycle response regulator
MSRTSLIPRASEPGEIVSLRERLGHLQILRLAIVLVVMAGVGYGFETDGDVREDLTIAATVYLALVGATELVRRRSRRTTLATLTLMLLIDGVYLASVMYLTGGTQSPLRFLLFVHLVAVTLLASYRTGLKIALWHSLLSLVVLYAQAAELLPPREGAPGVVPGPESGLTSLPVFNVTAFWVVALVTAAFSSLNERELRRRRADSEALAKMATEMEPLHRPADIAGKLLSSLAEELGFGRGVVLGARDGVTVLAHREGVDLPVPAPQLDPVVHEAWVQREPMLVKRLDARSHPVLAAVLPRGTRVLVVPLFAEGGLLGAVALEYPEHRGWRIERRIVSVVAQFAAYAALALRNAWLLEEIQRTADTDALTGVANRRAFDAALGREFARARRDGGSVGLLLLDVDHFKSFNDTYGHTAGDEVLAGLAATLVEECRAFDVVARYGGEEFAVILPGCALEESLEIGERLRGATRRLTAPAPITISVGVAIHPGDALDAGELIAVADDALYASKRAGRDRVSAGTRSSGQRG